MKKILLFITLLISLNSFSSINTSKGFIELRNIKKELILKYKSEIGVDYSSFENRSPNEKRVFYENLYLKFLSKYIEDLGDVKVYTGKDVNNVMIFANNPIDRSTFESIYTIILKEDPSKKLKLIQVPENDRVKFYGEDKKKDIVLNEFFPRKTVTLAQGEVIKYGQALVYDTTTGKYKKYDSSTPGGKLPKTFYVGADEDVDATTEDVKIQVVRASDIDGKLVVGVTDTDYAALDNLDKYGISVRFDNIEA